MGCRSTLMLVAALTATVAWVQPAAPDTPVVAPAVTASRAPERALAVYAELVSMSPFLAAGVSVAYRPRRWFAASAGVGGGAQDQLKGVGGQLAAHGLIGEGAHSLELALGVAAYSGEERRCGTLSCMDRRDRGVVPHVFLGYRHQALSQQESGLVLRVGIGGLSYGFGAGLVLSVGRAF